MQNTPGSGLADLPVDDEPTAPPQAECVECRKRIASSARRPVCASCLREAALSEQRARTERERRACDVLKRYETDPPF